MNGIIINRLQNSNDKRGRGERERKQYTGKLTNGSTPSLWLAPRWRADKEILTSEPKEESKTS